MIYLYHTISFLLLPIYCVLLIFRMIIGKEDIYSISERFVIGKKDAEVKDGTLVWLHAASVGESMIALTLIENINSLLLNKAGSIKFLVTSTTISSAKVLREKLPQNANHQFIPVDNIIFVRKFFKNWQPNLGILIESELWPCLIFEGKNHCKLLLLNARISDKSFKYWKFFSNFFQLIVSNFSEIITQSPTDFTKYTQLGATNIHNFGNIKFAHKKLPVDTKELEILSEHLINKKIIVFASTHLEDENVILNIIKPIKQQYPESCFILIPRHPERREDIKKKCRMLNLSCSVRSEQKIPVLTDDLYIVDRFGELGLFFSLANISFIGGSFKQGGHNILEPAHFSNCIIFGPDMSNVANTASDMLNSKAAIQIKNEGELLKQIEYFLSKRGAKEVKTYQTNALAFVSKDQQILSDYLAVIKKYLLKQEK